ncbi:MAG: hypothetical protein ABI131_00420 [Nostocoides sp.]
MTRASSFGAAQFGFLICLAFAAVFGLVVLVGEQRRKVRMRRASGTTGGKGTSGADGAP